MISLPMVPGDDTQHHFQICHALTSSGSDANADQHGGGPCPERFHGYPRASYKRSHQAATNVELTMIQKCGKIIIFIVGGPGFNGSESRIWQNDRVFSMSLKCIEIVLFRIQNNSSGVPGFLAKGSLCKNRWHVLTYPKKSSSPTAQEPSSVQHWQWSTCRLEIHNQHVSKTSFENQHDPAIF